MPGECSFDINAETVLDSLLADVIPQGAGTERLLDGAVFRHKGTVHQSVVHGASLHPRHCAKGKADQILRGIRLAADLTDGAAGFR